MASSTSTPPHSRTPSRSSHASSKHSLSIDLSDIPPLVQPSPPSNTLLVTNLEDPTIFAPQTLTYLHDLINGALSTAAQDPSQPVTESPLTGGDVLHTFSPLPSLRRIVLTFTSTAAAIQLRTLLDGLTLASGTRIRVYFGAETILAEKDQHLQAPAASKQFFISPPPSPPAGWTSRDEDPPNKEVHANDLAAALSQLGSKNTTAVEAASEEKDSAGTSTVDREKRSRVRSDSRTIVFHPEEHGHSPDLPAIAVEDTTDSPVLLGGADTLEGGTGGNARIIAHTARPPTELL